VKRSCFPGNGIATADKLSRCKVEKLDVGGKDGGSMKEN